ncbi:histone acetylation protein-domain-containing protein [Xylariomycetidae sp. FL2044]|nr:histone acetylation protein-domain-containing protein [Xylariomycetidae sp. FL2044]
MTDSKQHRPPHPLVEELSNVLPKDHEFTAHHLSTPPTLTDALCYPPAYSPKADSQSTRVPRSESRDRRPGKPLKTYCEKHFLTISIAPDKKKSAWNKEVLVLGLEIYIYTTAYSTIIFVAKADSTGYLSLLSLPKGTPSPIREVTAAFVAYLISTRKRRSKQLIVNLFARSQSQYLFPGSIKNKTKHVLDDRGLVKWWCRVLNPLVEGGDGFSTLRREWEHIHGYLVIPGLDHYETKAFLPRSSSASAGAHWTLGDPLERISPYTKNPAMFGRTIPPRCLIPAYPDDPKARFVHELEETTSEKAKRYGGWQSPRTLEQFWEMMAFRSECSSGRLTGFVWVVFDPPSASCPQESTTSPAIPATSPSKSAKKAHRKPRRKKPAKKALTGRIIPRKPHVKTHQRAQFPEAIETPHYYWPESGRGQVVLSENSYKRAVELLLHLEFSTLESATASTARWTSEVNTGEDWALRIVGQQEIPAAVAGAAVNNSGGTVNNLSGMIKRKRKQPPV